MRPSLGEEGGEQGAQEKVEDALDVEVANDARHRPV
jgi:hypothetical protein